MKYLGAIILFVCGCYFLTEALKSFPEKHELEYIEGQISSVSPCNKPIKGRFFQNIAITGVDGKIVEFKRSCVSGFKRLSERDVEKTANIFYEINYIYFLYPEVEVFHFNVDKVTYTDYMDKKLNRMIKPFNTLMGLVFLFSSAFIAIKIFNKRVNKDADLSPKKRTPKYNQY